MFQSKFFRSVSKTLVIAAIALVLVSSLLIPAASAQETTPPAPKPILAQMLESLGYDRLEVSFDENGEPSVLGMPIMAAARLARLDASKLILDPRIVKMMMDTNIQHIEVRQESGKMGIIVNNKVLPYVSWDSSRLPAVAAVANTVAPSSSDLIEMVMSVMPWMDKLGLSALVTFPVKVGVASIEPSDPTVPLPNISQVASDPKATVEFTIVYDEVGTPGILGFTVHDLARMGLYSDLALRSDVLQALVDNNVQNVELRTRTDGMIIFANNDPLISMVYDEQMLENASDVFGQINPTSPLTTTIANIPALVQLNLGIMATFVPADGAEIIELIPHANVVPGAVSVDVGEPAQSAASVTPAVVTTATPTLSATPTTSATPSAIATPTATPLPAADLVDVTCPNGQVHEDLTPEEAAVACPEGGSDW